MRTVKNNFVMTLLLFMFMFTPVMALADGAYVTGMGGYTFVPDVHAEFYDAKIGSASVEDGYKAGGSVGYDFGSFRAEAEVSNYWNDIESVSTPFIPALTGSGDASIFAVMGNVFYDIEIGKSGITPYVGGGVGWAQVDLEGSIGGLSGKVSDSGLAYQLIGGVSYDMTENLAVFTDYRYLRMDTLDMPLDIKADLEIHSVNAGVRFNF